MHIFQQNDMKQGVLCTCSLVVLTAFAYASDAAKKRPVVPTSEPVVWLGEGYGKISINDEVDPDEARLLAQYYSAAFISGCGGVLDVSKSGDLWRCETLVGRGANKGPTIVVHSKTGRISCNGYPTVEYDPMNYLSIKRNSK